MGTENAFYINKADHQIKGDVKIIIFKSFLTVLFILLFIAYIFQNSEIEKLLYVNEIFSFLGLLIFISNRVYQGQVTFTKNRMEQSVMFFIILCLIYLVFSIPFATNIYYYLRNGVIFYSVFAFYLGTYIFDNFRYVYNRFSVLIKSFVIFAILLKLKKLLGYFGGSIALAFSFRRITLISGLALIIFNFIYSRNFHQSTAFIIMLFLLFILIIRSFKLFKLILLVCFIIIIFVFAYLTPALKHYKDPPYRLYGNVAAVVKEQPILAFDPSIPFRLILYYRLIVEDFPGNLIGKGFGTPLINYQRGANSWLSSGDDEYDAHVTGAHCTYITIISRLGILSLLIFVIIYNNLFREFFNHFRFYNKNGLITFFIAFITISVIGLFNLVVESPIFASLYWILLGFVGRSIELRKISSEMFNGS